MDGRSDPDRTAFEFGLVRAWMQRLRRSGASPAHVREAGEHARHFLRGLSEGPHDVLPGELGRFLACVERSGGSRENATEDAARFLDFVGMVAHAHHRAESPDYTERAHGAAELRRLLDDWAP
jgi:hypothetical protein